MKKKEKSFTVSQFLSEKEKEEKEIKPQQPRKRGKTDFAFVGAALTLVFVLATALFILPLLPDSPSYALPHAYRGIVEMWNVETFEGGSGSRSAWITARAAAFEKKNEGLFVHVTNLTYEQAKDKLEKGDKFDIASFSLGSGSLFAPYLVPYEGSAAGVADNFLAAGEIGGKTYAMPFYAGIYCLFARKSDLSACGAVLPDGALTAVLTKKIGKNSVTLSPLTVGFGPFNSPLSAAALSEIHGGITPDYSLTQYSAYEKFIGGKTAVTLLGTQRDLFRLGNREEQGKIDALEVFPLGGYNDLVQFAGVSKFAENKKSACGEFIEYLISEESQRKLTQIAMFSVSEQSIYTSERYVRAESTLSSCFVPNVFSDIFAAETLRKDAVVRLNGGGGN